MVNTLQFILDKYDIQINGQYIVDIPNVGRNDLASLLAQMSFNSGVEVGVERGHYSRVLCDANPNLVLCCVDPWSPGAYEPGIDGVDTEQKKFDGYMEETRQNLKGKKAILVRKTSMEAVKDFDDCSLDFVYIDANHDFPNFINDLHQWSKKVRIGGIIAGHDYAYFPYKKHNHVKRALQAYARCYRMHPLFILGSMEEKAGTIRDKYRSWMWVKDK